MGTRSLVRIFENDRPLVTIYRQYDGYPTGMGEDIFNILNKGNFTLVNGFGSNSKIPETFNGILCLAAYLIGELKNKKIGNVYICPNDSEDEEFVYSIFVKKDVLNIEIKSCGKVLYIGRLNEFNSKEVEIKMGNI